MQNRKIALEERKSRLARTEVSWEAAFVRFKSETAAGVEVTMQVAVEEAPKASDTVTPNVMLYWLLGFPTGKVPLQEVAEGEASGTSRLVV